MAQGRRWGSGQGAMLLVCLAGGWGAGCRGDLADELRDLLGQQQGHGQGGASGPGTCGSGGAAGAPAPDAGQPDAGQPSPADIAAPRLIGPLSVSLGGANFQEFRWELAAGTDGASLEFCKDPACQQSVGGATFSGSSGKLAIPLQPGRIFWRARGVAGGVVGRPASAIWELFVPHSSSNGVTSALQTRADFNRDGYADFLLDGRVLLGGPQGYTGSWTLPAGPSDASGSVFFVAGDLNGDGFTDLVRLDVSQQQTPMGVWTATPVFGGAAGFSPGPPNVEQPDLLSGSMYSYAPAGDVNGDGYADVVVKTRSGAATFLGGPDAITIANAPAANTSQAYFASDGDLNGDGYSDALSNSNGEQAIEQSFGSATGFVGPATSVAAQPRIGTLVMLEANGDQFSDVAFTTTDGLQIFAGSSSGLVPVPIVTIPGSVAAVGNAELDDDPHMDLVVANGATLEVHYGAATGAPSVTGVPLATPARWKAGTFLGSFGDVNGDGYDDFTVGVMTDASGYNPSSAVLHLGGPNGLDPAGTAAM